MDFEIKNRIHERKIAGPAVTILEGRSYGENVGPTHAIEAIEAGAGGEIVVIQLLPCDRDVALWGGIMTAGAYVKKLKGAILDSGVRDVTEIRRDYDFPVYARSVSPGTTLGRYKTYDANVPITCGGVPVEPGDLIVADIDGVVAIPKDSVDEVLKIAEDIEEKEALQAKFIVETQSIKQGLAKYNRI